MPTKLPDKHLYRTHLSLEENLRLGPDWGEDYPDLPQTNPVKFLGASVNSPLGVAASVLTINSKWISVLWRLGYGVVTYKSVRTKATPAHSFPHWLPVALQAHGPVGADGTAEHTLTAVQLPSSELVSMANSLGVPSPDPDVWQVDVAKLVSSIPKNKALVLSLMPTPGKDGLIADVVALAKLAKETGVGQVEINLACPNSISRDGLLYQDVSNSIRLLQEAKDAAPELEILAKVGYFFRTEDLYQFVKEAGNIVSGITSLNTVASLVVDADGNPAFDGRPIVGISGGFIREMARAQALELVRIKTELGYDSLTIVGVGGVLTPSDARDMLQVGVDLVQSVTGVYRNPLLAQEFLEA